MLWRKVLDQLDGFLTCTSHPQSPCVVVVLAVRNTFRLDKMIENLEPFC